MQPLAIITAVITTYQLVTISRDPDSLRFVGGWGGLALMAAWQYSIAAVLYVGYGLWMKNRLRDVMRPLAIIMAVITTCQTVMISRDPESLQFVGGWGGLALMATWNYSIAGVLYVGYGLLIRRLRERRTRIESPPR